MVQTLHKFSLFGLARHRRVQGGIQDRFSLPKRRQITKVAKKLKEPEVSGQVRLADHEIRTLRRRLVAVAERPDSRPRPSQRAHRKAEAFYHVSACGDDGEYTCRAPPQRPIQSDWLWDHPSATPTAQIGDASQATDGLLWLCK